MKSMLIVATSLAISTCAYAQQPSDTLVNQVELNEVVVKSAPVINKADRKLYIPNAEQIKSSTNGTDLLRKLNIPTVNVNAVDQSIKLASNGKVDLRINGRAVTDTDIQGLDPRTVTRVEYHDNPSLRYGDAEIVIDFIVKNPTSGGSYYSNITQAVNKGYNDFDTQLKFNHKKSEFTIKNSAQSRWNLGQWRDNTEYYTRADGSRYERTEEGTPANADIFYDWASVSYCFTDPGKQMFWASASLDYDNCIHNDYTGILTNHDTGQRFDMSDLNSSKSNSYSLDLYYQRTLKKNNLVMFNLVGNSTPSRSNRSYTEYLLDENGIADTTPYTDIDTRIKGRAYHLVADAVHEKSWNNGRRLTSGLRYEGQWNKSEYPLLGDESTSRWHNLYAYSEYWQRLGEKIDLNLGVGLLMYRNTAGKISRTSCFARPRLALRYKASNRSTFRLNISGSGNTPSLSQLSNVVQQIDNTQTSVGNSELKNFASYRTQLQYEYMKGVFYGYLRSTYRYQHHPIMACKYLDGDNIINTYTNHRNSHVLTNEMNLSLRNWKNWVTASAVFGHYRAIMHGNDYTHTYNNFYMNGSIGIEHWNWTLAFEYQTNYNTFRGESLSGNESSNVIGLMYKYKSCTFLGAVMNPFSNDFKIESENRNRLAGYNRTSYLRATQRLVAFGVRWNINWGRKHKSAEKRLNNSGSSESVKATGKG